jgi:hypothetical protein
MKESMKISMFSKKLAARHQETTGRFFSLIRQITGTEARRAKLA